MEPTNVPDVEVPTVLGVPLNRILTIARGPINVLSGTIASWLLVHVHLFGLFHLQHDGLATGIAQGVVWLATAVLTDRGIAQWVKGHHLELQGRQKAIAEAVAYAAFDEPGEEPEPEDVPPPDTLDEEPTEPAVRQPTQRAGTTMDPYAEPIP